MRSFTFLRPAFLRVILPVVMALACDGKGSSGPPDSGGTDAGASDGGAPDGDDTDSRVPGCSAGSTTYPRGTTVGSIDAPGARSFRVHLPPGYAPGRAAPLVLMLHGGGGSALQLQTQSSNMDEIADREGFITVYPEGTGALATWNAGLCCGRAVEEGVDDVAFVNALLDHLEAELCVDRRRVYAMGMSNGALLSHRLACELSHRIAAIAPVAGTIGVTDCAPARPVAVMQIHGTSDGHVPWNGGVGCGLARVSFISVPDTMERWRVLNACGANQDEVLVQGDGRCTAYVGCTAPVTLCAIEGGGHSWPGGVPKSGVVDCPADGPQSATFSASEAAWRFFADNPRRSP